MREYKVSYYVNGVVVLTDKVLLTEYQRKALETENGVVVTKA